MTIGVDPGANAPAHVRIETLERSDEPLRATEEDVYVEGQYAKPTSSRLSLMTLSFHAGLVVGAYKRSGCRVFMLVPKVWRPALVPKAMKTRYRNAGTIDKIVFQNLCRRWGLIPDAIWDTKDPDLIDAYLIGLAGPKVKKKEEVPWKK